MTEERNAASLRLEIIDLNGTVEWLKSTIQKRDVKIQQLKSLVGDYQLLLKKTASGSKIVYK